MKTLTDFALKEEYRRLESDSVPKSSDKSGVTSLHKIYNFAIM